MRKSETKNSVAKAMDPGGPSLVADKNEHIELELMNALEEAYQEAVKEGFKGSREQYQDSLSLGQLKRIGASQGGLISGIRMQK
mgnify:CR=1 FL=1|tara:strand:+ start:32 stop:283 length:252 start_codon:yes stop_codon:yes gene_type:complete